MSDIFHHIQHIVNIVDSQAEYVSGGARNQRQFTYRWAPTVSLAVIWCMYALVSPRPPWSVGRQHAQVHPSSTGRKSSAKRLLLSFRVPEETIASPKRWLMSVSKHNEHGAVNLTAVRVGHTQSNMSAPRATATTMSSGYPCILVSDYIK